jgi:hypothetical protein
LFRDLRGRGCADRACEWDESQFWFPSRLVSGTRSPTSRRGCPSRPSRVIRSNACKLTVWRRRVRQGSPTCRFHRHLCRTCSLRSWDDAAIAFGVIYEASTAPCGSNAFHASSKRNRPKRRRADWPRLPSERRPARLQPKRPALSPSMPVRVRSWLSRFSPLASPPRP